MRRSECEQGVMAWQKLGDDMHSPDAQRKGWCSGQRRGCTSTSWFRKGSTSSGRRNCSSG